MAPIYKSPQGKQEIILQYEAILKYWPIPNKRHFIPTSYGDTFVIESGTPDGSPVLLLHGSTTNSAMWMGDAAVIGKTHKIYAIDIIGEPGKSAETRPENKNSNYARWLCDVMDALEIEKAAIVSNSLGGWMALDLATHFPNHINALILLAPGGICSVRISFIFKAMYYMMMGEKGFDKMNKMVLGDLELPPEAAAFSALIGQHFIPRRIDAPVLADDALKKLTMPILYIGGEFDVIYPSAKCAARLQSLVPHIDARVLSGTHHTLINMGQDIIDFLNKHGV